MAKQAESTEKVWFGDNDTYVAMRQWAADFTGNPAGEWNMLDVKLTIMVDYPGGIDAFIEDYEASEIF